MSILYFWTREQTDQKWPKTGQLTVDTLDDDSYSFMSNILNYPFNCSTRWPHWDCAAAPSSTAASWAELGRAPLRRQHVELSSSPLRRWNWSHSICQKSKCCWNGRFKLHWKNRDCRTSQTKNMKTESQMNDFLFHPTNANISQNSFRSWLHFKTSLVRIWSTCFTFLNDYFYFYKSTFYSTSCMSTASTA